jgi:hypothetical protein
MTESEMVAALSAKGYHIEAPRKKMDWNSLSPVAQKELRDNHECFMGGFGDEVLD